MAFLGIGRAREESLGGINGPDPGKELRSELAGLWREIRRDLLDPFGTVYFVRKGSYCFVCGLSLFDDIDSRRGQTLIEGDPDYNRKLSVAVSRIGTSGTSAVKAVIRTANQRVFPGEEEGERTVYQTAYSLRLTGDPEHDICVLARLRRNNDPPLSAPQFKEKGTINGVRYGVSYEGTYLLDKDGVPMTPPVMNLQPDRAGFRGYVYSDDCDILPDLFGFRRRAISNMILIRKLNDIQTAKLDSVIDKSIDNYCRILEITALLDTMDDGR